MEYSYDELYGVDIEEYCKIHNTTLEDLIQKSEIDIELLRKNMGRLLQEDLTYEEGYITKVLFDLIKKKQKHVDHLKMWTK
jgi:hypothetical protein